MPTLPDEARARIAKFVPTLSSDKAGEVAATAAAIGRVLKSHGCTWHDLAAVLHERVAPNIHDLLNMRAAAARERPPQYRDQMRPKADRVDDLYAARTQAEFRHRKNPVKGQVWARELKEAIDAIERVQGGDLDGLGERAFTFLHSLRDKCQKFDAIRISIKQDSWIRTIARENGVDIPWTEIEGEAP